MADSQHFRLLSHRLLSILVLPTDGTEIWFPVKEIGGLTDVSPMGVMNVEAENGKLRYRYKCSCFCSGQR